MRLSQLVTVRGRFHRSVSLTRDYKGSRDLSEYVVTPAVRAIAEQILGELRQPGGARAWSLTGPYGTGKSAFALFLADVLASKRPSHEQGKALRSKFLSRRSPMLPVLVQADRAPLLPAIAEAIATEFASVSKPIAGKARRAVRGHVGGEQMASLVVEAADAAKENGFSGLAIVVDEFGKFLEYAADNPTDADVYVLQQLAEAAARSTTPVLFATILHTGFADYLGNRDEVRKAEWQKVQGRFRDVAFQLPSEQLLALLGHAIEAKLTNGIGKAYAKETARILRAPTLSEALEQGEMAKILPACLPLHPVVALVLWPLFRSKVAQNERSLFAFLTSHEPHGFQEFLERAEASSQNVPLYGLPQLYDYVKSALGLGTYSGSDSRRWALIDHALQRVPASAPPIAGDIVKSIGLLAQYGVPVRILPSRETLELTVGAGDGFDGALGLLERESIVVYRRHSGSYGLWEGSDLDLEAALSEARSRLTGRPIHERLERSLELRPAVARAHYVKTGTLRFFESHVVSANAEHVDRVLRNATQADGFLLFVADGSAGAVERVKDLSKSLTSEKPALVAVPRFGGALVAALEEWECWQWVRDHVKELEGDPVARQEVNARIEQAREDFERLAGPLFGLAGYALDPTESVWFYRGRRKQPRSARGFQEQLSGVCEEVFLKAPRLQNELLNRHNLSSAAARARRNLLEFMVEGTGKRDLGIEGFPPEYSMYRSLLVRGGFHKGRGSKWSLRAPDSEGWDAVWSAMETFLAKTTSGPRSLTELIDILRAPPFGVRDGPIPVLVAALLLTKTHELALHEDGVFVPDVTIEVFERLTRRPETFELQSYQLTGAERKVLATLVELVQAEAGEDALLEVAKSLVRVAASLRPYVKESRKFDAATCAVRDALLNATDPKALVFSELPEALGVSLKDGRSAAEFGKRLLACTKQLSRGYASLLEHIEAEICGAFGIAAGGDEAREALRERCRPLVEFASEAKLQVFVREASREDERDWREVLGRAAQDGKPPSHWRDDDVTGLRFKLRSLVNEVDRLHELVDESGGDKTATVVSIGVLESGTGERRTVVACPVDDLEESDRVVTALRSLLAEQEATEQSKLLAAAQIVRELFDATREGDNENE